MVDAVLALAMTVLLHSTRSPSDAAVANGSRMSWQEGMNYLTKFGYVRPAWELQTHEVEKVMSEALRDFQWMARVRETGELDAPTEEMMMKPRCGVQDPSRTMRIRRYLHAGTKWNIASKQVLTWKVSRYTNQLRQADVDRELERAFNTWAEVTPLRFEKRPSGVVDIDVSFAVYSHNDQYPFDGRGGTLAHAYYPPAPIADQAPSINGDTHFDDSEPWTIDSRAGTNLFYVAVHEFGHALGLQHSNVHGSIMWPWAGRYDPDNPVKLAYDDIAGIQTLYGGPVRTQSAATTAPTRASTTAATRSSAQAVTTRSVPAPTTTQSTRRTTAPSTARTPQATPAPRTHPPTTARTLAPITKNMPTTAHTTRTPIASSARFTTVSRAILTAETAPETRRPAGSSPTTTPATVDECSRSLDEVVQATDGSTYGFMGGDIYRFKDLAAGVEAGFPKPIGSIFPDSPRNGIDAAVTFQGPFPHAKTYLFKGDLYYRYSLQNNSRAGPLMTLDLGFPKTISQGWGFSERDFDAVFLLNDSRSLYFVKGTKYWRHSGTSRGPFSGYPRSLASHSLFRSLPGITGAFRRADDVNYFFHGREYYRYDAAAASRQLVGPRPAGLWWFGCVAERLRIAEMLDGDSDLR